MAIFQSSSETSNSRIKLRLTIQKKTCVWQEQGSRPTSASGAGQGANRAPPEKLEVQSLAERQPSRSGKALGESKIIGGLGLEGKMRMRNGDCEA